MSGSRPPGDGAARIRGATVLQRGREKAFRPLPPDARRSALAAFLAAYDAGDHFEAHELLEPAWMGTDDPAERDLHQGLIKLAAAFVHAGRGNPHGVRKNLVGARARLADAVEAGRAYGIDVTPIVADIDGRLAAAGGGGGPGLALPAISIPRRGSAEG